MPTLNVLRSIVLKRLTVLAWLATLLFLSGYASASTEHQCSTLLVSGNAEYPPLLWRDSKDPDVLIGAVPALLNEIVEPMDIKVSVRYVGSWARVQHMSRTGELDMVAGAFMTSERFGYMDYILPPIIQLPTAVWVPAGEEFLYRHWPDLLGKTGSTLIGNSFGQNFDRYSAENLTMIPVRSIDQSFLMAEAGRVDYVLYEELQGRVKLERDGRADKFTALKIPISSEGLFYTFPKESPCNHFELREAIADRLYKLVQAGRVDKLVAEYTERYVRGD